MLTTVVRYERIKARWLIMKGISMTVFYKAGEAVSIGDAVYDVREGNTDTSPLVGIGYIRADGNATHTQYVHWRILERVTTIDYSEAVATQIKDL